MTQPDVREEVVQMIKEMPADATVPDIIEKLYFRARVSDAFKSLETNGGLDHAEVEQRMAKWLTE